MTLQGPGPSFAHDGSVSRLRLRLGSEQEPAAMSPIHGERLQEEELRRAQVVLERAVQFLEHCVHESPPGPAERRDLMRDLSSLSFTPSEPTGLPGTTPLARPIHEASSETS